MQTTSRQLMDDKDVVQVTQLLDITSLGISSTDVTWSQLRITSDKWVCVTKRNLHYTRDASNFQATVINPHSKQTISFSMEGLVSGQVNPIKSTVALTSSEKIFVLDLVTRECVAWNRFPCEVEYWTWISKNVIAMIGTQSVYHWNIDTDQMTFMFQIHTRLSGHEFTGYCTDSTLSWMVLSSLFLEADGSIGGMLQVFSSERDLSTCIEGHAAIFVDHTFPSRSHSSKLLILCKMTTLKSAKLCVTELGQKDILPKYDLISRMESFTWTNEDDIPSLLVCSSSLGLIYLLSKLGSLFVFELETCTPIVLHHRICPEIVFQAVLNTSSQGVMAISKNGQIHEIVVKPENRSKATPKKSNGVTASKQSTTALNELDKKEEEKLQESHLLPDEEEVFDPDQVTRL